MTTGFVLDALNQAIYQRAPSGTDKLVHHSDRGSQYLSIKYTERLAEAGIDPSVGSVGDSYDNALAESTIGLFKTEVIDFMGTWKSMAQVEWETLKWVNSLVVFETRCTTQNAYTAQSDTSHHKKQRTTSMKP